MHEYYYPNEFCSINSVHSVGGLIRTSCVSRILAVARLIVQLLMYSLVAYSYPVDIAKAVLEHVLILILIYRYGYGCGCGYGGRVVYSSSEGSTLSRGPIRHSPFAVVASATEEGG
eukprot:scaffold105847_cov35-Tisochrysis_lutea.AAC.1